MKLSNKVRAIINETPYRVRITKQEVAEHFKCKVYALNYVFTDMVEAGSVIMVKEGHEQFAYYKIAEVQQRFSGQKARKTPSKSKLIKVEVQKKPLGEKFYRDELCKIVVCEKSTAGPALLQMFDNKEIARERCKIRHEYVYWRLKDIDVNYVTRERIARAKITKPKKDALCNFIFGGRLDFNVGLRS